MISGLLANFSPSAAFDLFRSIFAEKRCPVCRAPHAAASLICEECSGDILEKADNSCILCGINIFTTENKKRLCADCIEDSPLHKRLYYYGPYDGLLRRLILDWKFGNSFGYGSVLSQLAVVTAQEIPKESHPDIIIPVPLHPSRLRKRGFNQSIVLGKSIAKALGTKFSDRALVRVRKTTPQTELSKNERAENMAKAFIADSSIIADKKILLIDDVYTTGATSRECTRTLYKAGAQRIEVLVLAKPLI
ncbi:ComF family protein [Maridesulfovibrio frigidus]|uniref:ComF family protein n=1 Tax=Maridesulfovibrio frigidus TaxID=340956 RepID=UPI0004E1C039|nr:ComF family protein [Maridesulfovibrio frigidus]